MGKRFRPGQPKQEGHEWWFVGAIAMPALMAIVGWLWLLPERPLQARPALPAHHESTALNTPHPVVSVKDVGAIAIVAGGLLVMLKRQLAHQDAQTLDLNQADFSGVNLNGADFSGVSLNGADFSRAELCGADFSGADLNGADLNGADLNGANFSQANLNGADLIQANLNGTNFHNASLKYANLSGADFRYANLSGADLRHANLSGADLNCTLLRRANFSDANLSSALLFFTNLRETLNLEPLQLETQPSPFLCHVALPSYAQQPTVNPNRACDRIPHLLSTRYHISLEEAQWIVNEARQHRWD